MERRLPRCSIVLPTVYDDALSYYEAICKLEKHLDNVVEEIEALNNEAIIKANAYTDSKILELRADMDNTVNEINRLYGELELQYGNFVKEVNNRIVLINARVDKMQDIVDSVLGQANAYTQQAIANNNEYIINETTKALETVKVVNYFTGERISVQEMFNYLAQFHLENAISYNQLVTKDKTYNQLIAYDMTYTQLALNGGTIIQ